MSPQSGHSFMLPDPALIYVALLVSIGVAIYQWYQSKKEERFKERAELLRQYMPANHVNAQKVFKLKLSLDDNLPSSIFRKSSIYVAVGYGKANSVLIQGPDGYIIVNPGSRSSAPGILSAFSYVAEDLMKNLVGVIVTRDLEDFWGAVELIRAKTNCDKLNVYVDPHADKLLHHQQFQDDKRIIFHTDRTNSAFKCAGLALEIKSCLAESREQIMLWLPQLQCLVTSGSYAELPETWQPILGPIEVRKALIVWKQNLRD